MKPKTIILDLDGTLCELKPESEKNNHTGEEKALLNNIILIFSSFDTFDTHIIILTGRKLTYKELTEKWLQRNEIGFDKLIMQEGHTAQKNHIFKEKKLSELKEIYDIKMMYDDNLEMIKVCKKLNIPLTII